VQGYVAWFGNVVGFVSLFVLAQDVDVASLGFEGDADLVLGRSFRH
jgi:HSP90 family molecular chaperone